jgi:hypothetical protein
MSLLSLTFLHIFIPSNLGSIKSRSKREIVLKIQTY